MSEALRLFVAVGPWKAVERAVTRALPAWRKLAPDARWVRTEQLHVTVAFLGSVGTELLSAYGSALAAAAGRSRPFELSVAGGGAFGSPLKPRVLWLGLGGAVDALRRLEGEVRGALAPLGYAPDHELYSPHLTLARARKPRGDPALAACAGALQGFGVGGLEVQELVLFRSETRPEGAHHEPIASYPLGTAAEAG